MCLERQISACLSCLLIQGCSKLDWPSASTDLQSCIFQQENSPSPSVTKYFDPPPSESQKQHRNILVTEPFQRDLHPAGLGQGCPHPVPSETCVAGECSPPHVKWRLCPAGLLPACCDSNDSAHSSQIPPERQTMVQWLGNIF